MRPLQSTCVYVDGIINGQGRHLCAHVVDGQGRSRNHVGHVEDFYSACFADHLVI